MTTGKIVALTRPTFVGKVMSLLFNMLSRLVTTFLPRRKRLLISWLQSTIHSDLGAQNIKSDTVSTVSPSISHEVMGPDAMILVFWIPTSNSIHSTEFQFLSADVTSESWMGFLKKKERKNSVWSLYVGSTSSPQKWSHTFLFHDFIPLIRPL